MCLPKCLWIGQGRVGTLCLATETQSSCDNEFVDERTCLSCPKCRTIYKISGNELIDIKCVNKEDLEKNAELYKSLNYCWAADEKTEDVIAENWQQPPASMLKCEGPGPTLKYLDERLKIDKNTGIPYLYEQYTNSPPLILPQGIQLPPLPGEDVYDNCLSILKECQQNGQSTQYNYDPLNNTVNFNCVNSDTQENIVSQDVCQKLKKLVKNPTKIPHHRNHPEGGAMTFNSPAMIGYEAAPGTKIYGPYRDSKCENSKKCKAYLTNQDNSQTRNMFEGLIPGTPANCVRREFEVSGFGKYSRNIINAIPYRLDPQNITPDCITDSKDCDNLETGFGVPIVGTPKFGGDPCT